MMHEVQVVAVVQYLHGEMQFTQLPFSSLYFPTGQARTQVLL